MRHLFQMPLFARFFRAGVLLALIALVYQQARWFDSQKASSISLRQARKYFPAGYKIQLRDPARGLHYVTDARGNTIGCILTTSPQTDSIIGYSGPNNLLLAIDGRGALCGLELLHSGDTPEHVKNVKNDTNFFRQFIGWFPNEPLPTNLSGVSGATLTASAIAETIQQRLGAASPSLRFPEPVSLSEIQALFTNATSVSQENARWRVTDATHHTLGFILRTSPQADNVSGYRGPTECLVSLAPDGRTVTGLRIRSSFDTDSYVSQVTKAEHFTRLFVGKSIDELAAFEFPKDKIEGISSATQTAQAVSEGLRRRLAAEIKSLTAKPRWFPKARDWGLASVIAGALILSFTSLRSYRSARVGWQLLLVIYVGLLNHDLLSLALLGGWAAHGLTFKAAPALVLLVAASFLVPWGTRHQLYCHQLCPHGAAQQLLGALSRKRWALSGKTVRWLQAIPVLILALALASLLTGIHIDLALLEPFDAWVWHTATTGLLIFAVAGLVLSFFIPQAYCRFGCPTGALLNFLRSHGSADHWSRRDWIGLAFVSAAFLLVVLTRLWPRHDAPPEPLALRGQTMGTTWSVKIFDEIAEPSVLEKAIADEFQLAESFTSHWRTNSDISLFNATPSTNEMPVPWPVISLARRAREISQASSGAFDITVAPLVRLWGFGPGARRGQIPTPDQIAAVLPAVGSDKLQILDGVLRKTHPALEIDLSSIAKGWAIDQVAQMIEVRGYTNFLVEAGGELRARGRWTIAIELPPRTCILTNESIATSGTYRQNYQTNGIQYAHLIDPRTGRPITHNTVSVSVRHRDCALADAWATALNVLGAASGLPLAERLNLSAQFVVELSPGKFNLQQTSRWK